MGRIEMLGFALRLWAPVLATALLGLAIGGCRSSLSFYREGLQHLEAEEYGEAVEAFSGAIDRDPESDLNYLNRGDAYMALKQYDKAVEDYDRAIALLKAPNPWFYNRRGLAYYHERQYARALGDWRKAKDLEDRRAARGLKVRKSPAYIEMQAMREDLLAEVERQALTMPEVATTSPAPAPEAAPTAPEVAVVPPPEEPAPSSEEQAAIEEDRLAHEAARVRAEEERKAAALPPPLPAEPVAPPAPVAEPAPPSEEQAAIEEAPVSWVGVAGRARPSAPPSEEQAAIEEARLAHEAARVRAEEERKAAALPPPAAPTAPAEPGVSKPEAPLAAPEVPPAAPELPQAAAPEPAIAAPEPVPAARVEKVRPVANLTGTWMRKADELKFSFVDDGKRVVGEVTGTEDYVFYDVTLEWQAPNKLAGHGILKENLSPCKFETTVEWTLEVVGPDALAGKAEEVSWTEDCKEVDRTLTDCQLTRVR